MTKEEKTFLDNILMLLKKKPKSRTNENVDIDVEIGVDIYDQLADTVVWDFVLNKGRKTFNGGLELIVARDCSWIDISGRFSSIHSSDEDGEWDNEYIDVKFSESEASDLISYVSAIIEKRKKSEIQYTDGHRKNQAAIFNKMLK